MIFLLKIVIILVMKAQKYNRVIFILSIVGVIIAIYVFQSFVRQTSIICVNSGCEIVRKNPASYILGFPVPGVGLFGYSFLAVLAFSRTISSDKRLLYAMLGISTFGVAFVSWFTYTELFVIRAICTWCAVSAVNMLVIFALCVKSYKLTKNKK